MVISGYDPLVHDRFTMEGTEILQTNGSTQALAARHDLSGVGWDVSFPAKSFGFLTPQHYLVASHFGGATTLRLMDSNGSLTDHTQRNITQTVVGMNLSKGRDVSVGALTAPVASGTLPRYAVLDLNPNGWNDPWAYYTRTLLVYGRGTLNPASSPRIAETLPSGCWSMHYISSPRSNLQLETYDSGSPNFVLWTNPAGGTELALVGNHAAIGSTDNFHNFIASHEGIASINGITSRDGFALRVVGEAAAHWSGSESASLSAPESWDNASTPAGMYAQFDPATSASREVRVDADFAVRGLILTDAASSGEAFTFTGPATLGLGHGGIVNYGSATHSIQAGLRADSHQYWDVGSGALTIASLDTNGRLVEIASNNGHVEFTGTTSGTGSLAVNGGEVLVSGNAAHTGRTWVHDGTLRVNGSLEDSAAITLGASATLGGSGYVGHVEGSGSISPGASPGILTVASLDPTSGLDFHFEFTALGMPDFTNPSSSVNDVLRITGDTPFTAPMSAAFGNEVHLYLNIAELAHDNTFIGGFFADRDPNLHTSISGAAFFVYLADVNGDTTHEGASYSLYTGPHGIRLGTVALQAAFTDGVVYGTSLQITALPESETAAFLVAASCLAFAASRRRTQVSPAR